MLNAQDRKLAALHPIRQAVMGAEVEGHFGLKIDPHTGWIEEVHISLKDGPKLHISARAVGGLDVSLHG